MEKCYELFRSFISDITKVFPEYNERLHDTYEDIFLENDIKDDYLNDFFKRINKYSEKISEKNESFFESDPIILQNVSFKMMWNSKITQKTKNTIWSYLISFCIMEIQIRCGDKIINVLFDII